MTVQPYHCFQTRVARIERLSPHFLRMTLSGNELAHACLDGPDQRIKLLLPLPDGTVTDVGQFDAAVPLREWYARWRLLDDARRNPMRTYTARAVRPERCELDIDFVLHGDSGPASAWAASAEVGAPLVVIGPDARAAERGGVEWRPGAARSVLIAGDETAVPAACAIVESLPATMRGEVYLEVPEGGDVLPLRAPAGVHIHWLPRDGAEHGELLTAAVRDWGRRAVSRMPGASAASQPLVDPGDDTLWEVPERAAGTDYAWLAGESGTITALRRHLVRDLGIDRGSVAFMGYWRRGRPES